jgi:hypothetical protein
MAHDFVEEKELEFIESTETGDFWGGVDECGEHFYELYVTAGKDGPTPAQVHRYRVLCEKLDVVYNSIRERFRSQVGMEAGLRNKWQHATVALDIVSVYEDGSKVEIDICGRGSRRVLFFSRHLDFVVGLRDNQIMSFSLI